MPAAEQTEYLYDAGLLPQQLLSSLPAGLSLRPLAASDYPRGHLELLTHLTAAPDVGQQAWSNRFEELKRVNAAQLTYLPVVIVEDDADRIVGQATVFLERKFLRNAGLCGHIEDVVVDPRMQGKKLGLKLIEVLTALSEHAGAYKTILDCDPKNEAFYAKCGYENKGCEMAKYRK
ncbi:hypothetical protein JCM8115_001921 [Rhodotorula mucilaginosa]